MDQTTCKGFRSSGVAAGLKKNGDPDLGLIVSDTLSNAAAVFTRNKVVAAPVMLDKEKIVSGRCRAIIANSGNANCATGAAGLKAAGDMTAVAAKHLGIDEKDVLVASTGVIGEPLPVQKVEAAVPALVSALNHDGFEKFARAIMTTDTEPKVLTTKGNIDGNAFAITAVAKGAGMIRPDMATMLCFVCTDIKASRAVLNKTLKKAVDVSFNRISVDGDTSTNDTVIIMANGHSGASVESDDHQAVFQSLLTQLLTDMAKWLVRDGEGVTKLVEVRVKGAASRMDAEKIADTISHSPLVKTAFFGEDANWGRIIGAAGRSGAAVDPDKIDLFFDAVQMVKGGIGCGKQAESMATQVLKKPEFVVTLDMNLGSHQAFLITCDFSIDYVKINADYRT